MIWRIKGERKKMYTKFYRLFKDVVTNMIFLYRVLKQKQCLKMGLVVALVLIAIPDVTYASVPWESPISVIKTSISGPVAKAVCIISIIITGLSIALGEGGGWVRRCMQIVFGISAALLASSFISDVWSTDTSLFMDFVNYLC